MTEEQEIDYKAEYEKVIAERDAYASKLEEYITANNKLSADLKVQQAINRKTVGVSTEGGKDDIPKKVSLSDAISEYKASLIKSKE